VEVESGEDLFALEALMPTFRDWLVICQRRVPVVWQGGALVVGRWKGGRERTHAEVGGQHAG